MKDEFITVLSIKPLEKLAFAKLKMITQLSLVLVSSYDTKDYQPGQKKAPTKGFMWLDHQILRFLRNGDISYEDYNPDSLEGFGEYDYSEDTKGNLIIEGHMMAMSWQEISVEWRIG